MVRSVVAFFHEEQLLPDVEAVRDYAQAADDWMIQKPKNGSAGLKRVGDDQECRGRILNRIPKWNGEEPQAGTRRELPDANYRHECEQPHWGGFPSGNPLYQQGTRV